MGTDLLGLDGGGQGGTSGLGGAGGAGGAGDSGGQGGTTADTGGTPDTGGGKSYKWIAIFDETKTPPVCTGSGPGADIDSVDLRRTGTSVIGVGLKGSAMYVAGAAPAVACTMCGTTACPILAPRRRPGPKASMDARSFADATPDVGYLSLNNGVVWLQIGSSSGNGPAQDVLPGDTLTVNEVDKYYVAIDGRPARVTARPRSTRSTPTRRWAIPATRVQLMPTKFQTENMTVCGATPTGMLGCGSTDFLVP